MNASASIATENARRYLGQFVKHFAHKLPAAHEEDNTSGEVEFPLGLCTLDADAERLAIIINAATAEALAALRDVVDQHLLRFAFREELAIVWQ